MSQQPHTPHLTIKQHLFHLRRYIRWVRQGRPRRHPVILKTLGGASPLYACPHGYGYVAGAHIDGYYMDSPNIRADELWDYLSSQYPTTRVQHLQDCPHCKKGRTQQ